MVAKTDIMAGLQKLRLPPGAGLVVHSSLKSLGHVEDGPATVIVALMEHLTPDGTLLMPTFNHDVPFRDGGPSYFHPGETPTLNGLIPETFWRMPGVYRSLNPTHPFAAWGRHARRYIEFHHRTLTMGPQSPLGLLYEDDGLALLIGVDYTSNTFHHVVEMSLGVPCLGRRTEAYPVILPDGRRVMGRTWGWRKNWCPFTDENRYFDLMEGRGLQQDTQVGESRFILFRLRDCYRVVAEVLQQGRAGFPPCRQCPIRPRRVAQTVESDWDSETQSLLPTSEAWSY